MEGKHISTTRNEEHNGYTQINIQGKLKISRLHSIKEVEYLKSKMKNITATIIAN